MPDSAARSPKKRPSKSPKVSAGAMATSFRLAHGSARATSMLAGAVLAAVVTGIVVNALALQKGHHPAPFFGRSFVVPDETPQSAVVPTPPARPAAIANVDAQSARIQAPAATASDAGKVAPSVAANDPIAQLINKGSASSAKPAMSAHAGRVQRTPAAN